ncbi:MAG: MetQ/NlpA family ABC transporter substrate-binding protein [Facklamia hominis]|uniref:MetQ/NlpA family ABC transporter substrate-binding protein n=1 Tax=Facklamia hominis TaxID=178214 RepID=UPI000C7C0DFB|nr:MetQ/NlpA family ABC transporter substrate-binding protein [Facklamia hominis]PKY92381.1 methionine-binding protein [Facklamia hominis]
MKKLIKILALALLILTNVFPLSFVNAKDKPFDGQKVRIGVVGSEDEEIWKDVAKRAKEQEGIDLEVVLFTDYNMPNQALTDGSIDLNAFQHDVFLENWNKENKGDIVTLAYTVAVPIRIYSTKYTSLEDLPEGAKIAVNSAPTSLSYNLFSLQRAGLITLKDNGELLPTPRDVEENPKNIEFVELEAAQIPAVIEDVDAAFIDDSFLESTPFEPADAIYIYGDTPETINLDRVNNIVARGEDQDNPLYQKIVELYQTDETSKKIEEVKHGGAIAAWDLVKEAKSAQ